MSDDPLPPLAEVEDLAELHSISNARNGDLSRLCARLRSGWATRREAQLAADLLEGEVRPHKSKTTWFDRLQIADEVAVLKQVFDAKADDIVAFVAEDKHVSKTLVYDVMREFDEGEWKRLRAEPKPSGKFSDALRTADRELLLRIIDGFAERLGAQSK